MFVACRFNERDMYKSLRMAHEKLLMCETNLHRYGLYLRQNYMIMDKSVSLYKYCHI